ncbi:hypothetical protein BDFB_008410 [Asbolus verrucosus]|uniref:Uncharacterized protein n=1 Tax=Asbolus verrucosus TaxID=1661398 RepID=A0A482WDW4_ASBVE|nr:hypothetical protein BDFB_008410 [Asbolus verrucosus]
MLLKSSIFLIAAISAVLTSPLPSKNGDTRVLYDQRQEGELNILADLRNFVILVIPTTTSTSPTSGSLLDFLYKAVPKRAHLKRFHQHLKRGQSVPGEETMNFIESKTAPYHVDISRSRNHLTKLHPEPVPVVNAEEIVIAQSPTIALVKDENHSRTARAFVLTVPPEEGNSSKTEDKKKKDGKKKNKEAPKSMLKLLGAENEQCGPGLARDSEGVCRTVKN